MQMKWKWQRVVLALASALFIVGCGIPEEEHNAVVRDLEETKLALSEAERAKAKQAKQLEEMEANVAALNERVNKQEEQVDALEMELNQANSDLKLYAGAKEDLEKALEASKAELVALREARAQAERRAAQYRKLTEKLAAMVRSGKLTVKIRNGNMVIQLPDNVLFDPGKAELKEDGQAALKELASTLQEFQRNYLVAGHTDNIPIKSGRYDSNWNLSTARAVEVVTFLQESGVPPKQLAAAGYGEFDPVASNEDKEGRALNRRIEIILMPNLNELPALPKDVLSAQQETSS